MLIAHAPAGFITLKLYNKLKGDNIPYFKYGLIFSIWPDLDLLYFYLIDKKSTLHHFYFPHIPAFLFLACCLIPILKSLKLSSQKLNLYYLFLINWFVHLILDTVSGGINWLYPFSDKLWVLVKIPANYSHWMISFVLHWSFSLEIGIVAWAGYLFFKNRRVKGTLRECHPE